MLLGGVNGGVFGGVKEMDVGSREISD